MLIFGLAAWYKMNSRFTPIPTRIPTSRGNTRQATNVMKHTTKQLSGKKKQNCHGGNTIANYLFKMSL